LKQFSVCWTQAPTPTPIRTEGNKGERRTGKEKRDERGEEGEIEKFLWGQLGGRCKLPIASIAPTAKNLCVDALKSPHRNFVMPFLKQ